MSAPRGRVAPGPETVLGPAQTPGVEWVEVEDQLIVWSDSAGELHRLDPIATLVFHLCDGETSLGATVTDLAGVFGRGPEQIRDDVMRCAEQLWRSGLVEPVASPR